MECLISLSKKKKKFYPVICPGQGRRPSSIVYVSRNEIRPDQRKTLKSNMTTWKKYGVYILKKRWRFERALWGSSSEHRTGGIPKQSI